MCLLFWFSSLSSVLVCGAVFVAAKLAELKQLEEQLAAEQQQHSELIKGSEVLQGKLTHSEQTVAHLEEETKTKNHLLVEIRSDAEERENQLQSLRVEFEAQQLAALQTSNDLEAANQTIKALEVEISSRDMTVQNMHCDIEYKEQKLSEVIAGSAQTQQLVNEMERRLSAQDEEVERLKRELETSRQEMQQVRAELEAIHGASVTIGNYQQLKEHNEALQSSVTDVNGEMMKLATSLDQSQAECQQLRASLQLTSSSDDDQKAAVLSLEAQLQQISAQSQEEISQWKMKVSSVSDQLNTCMSELEQLKECQRIVAEEKASLQVVLSGRDEQLRAASYQQRVSEETVHRVRMELEAAQSAHQMTVGNLQRQVEDSEQHVKEMEESLEGKDRLLTDTKTELEDVKKRLEDITGHEAKQQQMFVDCETLLSNTIATLHQQLEQSATRVEFLSMRCSEQDAEVLALKKKLDDRDAKITSLSENFREEELQLVALTEELEACKAQAASDKVLADTEWQKIIDSKNAEIAGLTKSADSQETQTKKYIAAIKKLKQQLQEEKLKREDAEKQSTSFLNESAVEQFPAMGERPSLTDEPDKLVQPVIPLQQSMQDTVSAASEMSCLQLVNAKAIKAASKQEIYELKEMNEQLQCAVSKLEGKCSEFETAVTHLNGIVMGLKEENETLKASAEVMSIEMRKASDVSCAEIQELSADVSHWKSIAFDVEQMRKEVAKLESEKSEAIAKAGAVMSEMTQLKSDLDAKLEEMEQLNVQLSGLIAENESVKHELVCSQEINAKIQSEFTNISDDRIQLGNQLAVALDTMLQLSDDNKQLRISSDALKEQLQALRTEAEAAKAMATTSNRVEAECVEKEEMAKDMQVDVEQLHQALDGSNWKSLEQYSVLETKNLHLTEQCSSLVTLLEEDQRKYEASVKSAAEKERHLAEESEKLLQKLKLAEEGNAVLEQRLKEVESDYAKNVDSFKKVQSELEAEKRRSEMELGRLTDMVLKSEGTIQQLVAELGAEREEFSLRESELEGSSEELQLEVARLAQKVETDVEELEDWKSRHKEIEVQLNSLVTDKYSVERERNEYYEQSRKLVEENELLKTECEELRKERDQLASECELSKDMAERKYAALSGQYDMLSTDINNYQELVESLRFKNSQLEQQLQKTSADDAAQVAVSRELEMERKRMENERRAHIEELGSVRLHESELLSEVERLQLQVEDYSNTDEELSESRSRIFTLQTENDSLRENVGELEQRVQELGIIEEEQAALQERYLSVLQDNNALIRQSKEMYEKLRSFNELADNSGNLSTAEVAALRAEVETLRSERENATRRDQKCKQLHAELLALKTAHSQQTSQLQALRASKSWQSFTDDRSQSPERVHHELSPKTSDRFHTVERRSELEPNDEAARVHVVPLHFSTPHKPTSDDRINEINHLKAEVITASEW